jgi:bifunctional DNA-binding transcriptional regulator/antitoxin component of YhaV-PrlF toxin-antitoxin module
MSSKVRIDRQGRIVVPFTERRRLGLEGGEVLTLVPTPEGLVLERRHDATVRTGFDGLPVLEFADPRRVSGAEAVAAIRSERDER